MIYKSTGFVLQLRSPEGATVVGDWQKPRKLLRMLIERHAKVPGKWILEAMCGSATASVVALTLGMNAVAVDDKPYITSSVRTRLSTLGKATPWTIMHSEEAEIRTKAQWKALLEERKKAKFAAASAPLLRLEGGPNAVELPQQTQAMLKDHADAEKGAQAENMELDTNEPVAVASKEESDVDVLARDLEYEVEEDAE